MDRFLSYRILFALFILGCLLPGMLVAQKVGCNHYKQIQGIKDRDTPKYWMGIGLVSMDINKDGHLDLLASANGPNTVFVYFGGPEIFDTTADLTLKGSGEMVKGDFNGDGLADLAVRIRFFRDEERHVTRFDTFLVYMGVEDSLYAIETQARHIIPGPLSSKRSPTITDDYSNLGEYLFAADLDGDGRDELIMASSNYFDPLRARAGSGAIFVWHYPRGDDSDTLSYIYATDNDGYSINSFGVGDVNGDGIADIQLCLREKRPDWSDYPPRIRVGLGQPGKYPDLSRPDQFFENDVMRYARDTYADRIAGPWTTLLDVNNDGFADLLWVPCIDSLWIMHGTTDGLSGNVDRIIANHDRVRWQGFGWRHHKIGDYNGDGFDDYILDLSASGFPAMVVYGGGSQGLTSQPIAVCVAGGRYGGRYYVSLGDITGDGGEEICTSDPIPPGIQESWVQQPGFVGIIRSATWIKTDADVRDAGQDPEVSPFSVDIYPSPTTGDITMLLKDEAPGEYQLRLYELGGKVILTRNYQLVNSGNVIVLQAGDYASDYSPGVHFIELRSAAGSVTRKVLLMKK